MVDDTDYAHHIYGNNKWCTRLKNIFNDVLCAISVVNYNFPILMPFLSFLVFYKYISSS